jgi:hypothetical protein
VVRGHAKIHATHWLLTGVCEGIRVGINGLALNLVRPATIVSQTSRNHTDIHLRHGDCLAIVQRLNGSEDIQITLDQISKLDEQAAAVLWRDMAPSGLESLARGGDGDVDVLLSGLGDGADDGLVGWVDDLEGLAVDALNPLVVDEAVREMLAVWAIRAEL